MRPEKEKKKGVGFMSNTEAFWRGDFGDSYTQRNKINYRDRLAFWQKIVDDTGIQSALEIGCNSGHNLEALRSINRGMELSGVDVNESALLEASIKGFDVEDVNGKNIVDIFGNGACDLVFTCGVLIHIAPKDLKAMMRNIITVSRQYVLAVEYHADKEKAVEYRGNKDKLWKRDYGKLYQDMGLSLIESGEAEGFDQCQFYLLEKEQ